MYLQRTASHSNSNYSAAGDYRTEKAPAASSIGGIKSQTVNSGTTEISIPFANVDIATPEATTIIGMAPTLAIPLNTLEAYIPKPQLQESPNTPTVKGLLWTSLE